MTTTTISYPDKNGYEGEVEVTYSVHVCPGSYDTPPSTDIEIHHARIVEADPEFVLRGWELEEWINTKEL